MKLIKVISVLFFLTLTSCGNQSKNKQSSIEQKNKSDVQYTNQSKTNHNSSQQNNKLELQCGDIVFYSPYKNRKNIWQKLKVGKHEFDKINSNEHNVYFVEECESLNISIDKRIFLVRIVLTEILDQDDFTTTEAPFAAFDVQNQDYANYFGIVDKKVLALSVSNDKAEFVNSHDFLFEDNIYTLSDEFLNDLPLLIKNDKVKFDLGNIQEYIKSEPINEKNVKEYNDIAYYLSEKNNNNESIFLLNKIINQFPNHIVAYLNLGDSYWSIGNSEEAKKVYQKYISLMKSQAKDLNKIPKRVYDRIK
jgi:tetratricopeptide (TPR) repeat protein